MIDPKFWRWGPYALLGLSALVSAATSRTLMSPAEIYTAAMLVAAALGWQLAWDRRLRELPDQVRARAVYFFVRTALAFALSMINPFFSIYAVMGYFDAGRQLPSPSRKWGLLAIALTLALSQSAVPQGPPPRTVVQWAVFAALFVLHSALALLLDRFNDQTEKRQQDQQATIDQLARALADNEALQAQLLVQAREAGTADERRRIAAEIHDTLAQGLTGIITQLQASLDSIDTERARAHVEQAVALARYSLGEARRSVHDLTPGPLEHRTLPEALETTVARWAVTSATDLELVVTGTVEPLDDDVQAALLRITEEALSNVAKHAQASRAGITLSYFDNEVTLDIRDDGRGFAPDNLPPRTAHGGFGLAGMRLRAQRVAGTVEVESEAGDGTAVAVRIPLVRHDS